MTITWDDIGRPQQAGEYPWRDGWVNVRATEIAIWLKEPDAVFNVSGGLFGGKRKYSLGSRAD